MPITHIDIESKKVDKKSRRPPWWKILLVVVVSFVLLTSIATVYLYPKVRVLAKDVEEVSNQARSVQKNIEKQNVVVVKDELLQLRQDLKKTQNDLSQLAIIGKLPLINAYYNDARHALKAGVFASQAGEIVADSITPFGDILGLKGTNSDLKGKEKVKVLVTEVLPRISQRTDDLEVLLSQIKREIDEISTNRFPPALTIKGINIRKNLESAKFALVKSEEYLPLLKNGAQALPLVLGYQKEKTYLVWFQNDGELRATGGFITAYGFLKVKDGELLEVESDDIYQLDRRFVPTEEPPEVFRKYLLLTIFPIRDTNISPDFRESAEKFLSFYRTIPSQPKVDGVIAIDTSLVEKFLKITGPIILKQYGETFSAKPHPDYRISDAVYKLELYAQRILKGRTGRKGPVGDLMEEVLDRLFNAKSEQFPAIFDTVLGSLEAKNIQFYFFDQKAQKLSEELGFAGRIKDFDKDYLHVNNSNVAGLKGNFFTKYNIEQEIVIKSDGTVVKKDTTTISNTFRYDGWLNATYQNWLRLYVPKGSKLLEKNISTDFEEKDELGKKVWSAFSRTPPFTTTSSSFTYELPFKIKRGDMYKMLIQKQGGYIPRMIIKVNGKKLFEFDLKKDTDLEFKI